MPAYHDESSIRALVLGCVFGFFTYATYDLTNQATLRNWTSLLSFTGCALGLYSCGLLFLSRVYRVGSLTDHAVR